jgi:Ca2+/Na+ antiporter
MIYVFWIAACILLLLYLVGMFFIIKNYNSWKKSQNKRKLFLILGFLLFVLFMATSGSSTVAWVYVLGALLGIGLSIKRVDENKPND